MGNSNIEEPRMNPWEIAVFRYSHFYGRHEVKDNYVTKRYELSQEQRDAFVGLIQSYQKIQHPALIKIQNVRLTNTVNGKYSYQLDFPHYHKNLAVEIKQRMDNNPYSQEQVVKLILELVEILAIFQQKQFPFGCLSLDQISLLQPHQGYCIGLEILMNTKNIDTSKSTSERANSFLSPQERQLSKHPTGFDMTKSTVFSVGLIALSTIVFEEVELSNLEDRVFELRKDYSYQFCNLLKSMLHLDNFNRVSLEQCMQACRDLLSKQNRNDQVKDKLFIRGYNCVQSLWLFPERKEQQVCRRWKMRYAQKNK